MILPRSRNDFGVAHESITYIGKVDPAEVGGCFSFLSAAQNMALNNALIRTASEISC